MNRSATAGCVIDWWNCEADNFKNFGLPVSAEMSGLRPDMCGRHLRFMQKTVDVYKRGFLPEMRKTSERQPPGILYGLSEEKTRLSAGPRSLFLSGSHKEVPVSDEICK